MARITKSYIKLCYSEGFKRNTHQMKYLSIILACLLLQGCTMVESVNRPQAYFPSVSNENRGSLLDDTNTTLEDEKINALLYQPIAFPSQIRIAILKLEEKSDWQFYSNDFTQLNDAIKEVFIEKLRSSSRVYDASFLPALLIPQKYTLSILRESAARFQADALLIYRSFCSSYQKTRFIHPDETKAYCSVEAILLDVRKGVIGKSVVSIEKFTAKKQQDEINFIETIKKAELAALAKALGKIAEVIVNYLMDIALLKDSLPKDSFLKNK
jgi:hypothetical protein